MTPRWDVSDNNKKGKAHYWTQSPMNYELARSHCGTVEAIKHLQGIENELSRCKVCKKRLSSNETKLSGTPAARVCLRQPASGLAFALASGAQP